MVLFSLGLSDGSPANAVNNFLRGIFSVLDQIAFFLLTFVFQLFFNVSTVDIFSNETVMTFYYRIQVILGVFMMFQLAMTIIKGIVDPDSFNDKKSGAASLIKRIAIALLMLVLLVPIRSNNQANEYEKQLNNNGILFGTLYSLQNRIIQGNVVGKLVLGEENAPAKDFLQNQEELKSEANKFASAVLRVFYRINLRNEEGNLSNEDDWMCREWPDKSYEEYIKEDVNPGRIILMVNTSCDDDGSAKELYQYLPFLKGGTRYAIAYMPIIPAIVGLLLAALILSFSLDVGIRAIKLGFLKLLAPIPIISYMDPKGSKDSAFNSWVKQLTSTYLDLFVRLLIIYFILAIVMDIQQNGLIVGNGADVDGIMAGLTKIIIYIALFLFGKQAPKFFKSLFGIKDDGEGFGGMFKSLGTAVGLGAAGLGVLGSFNASRRASIAADRERFEQEADDRGLVGDDRENYINGRMNSMANRGKHLVAGIFGGAAGGLTGIGAALGAKDHATRAALDAQHNRNAAALAAGRSGGTFGGAIGSSFREMLTGESLSAADEAHWAAEEAGIKADELALKTRRDELKRDQDINAIRKKIMDRIGSKVLENSKTTGRVELDGGRTVEGNYASFMEVLRTAQGSGANSFTFGGATIDMSEAAEVSEKLKSENERDYYEKALATMGTDDEFDGSISINYRNFNSLSSEHPLETNLRDLKQNYSNTNGDLDIRTQAVNAESQAINNRRQDLNTERTSRRAQRNKSNAERFRSSGKK